MKKAINAVAKKVAIAVKEGLTHAKADWDEIVANCLFMWYGEECFPGSSKSTLQFASVTPVGLEKDYLDQGTVVFGCGESPDGQPFMFNEHVSGGTGRIPDKCSAILVAEYIGVADKPCLRRLLVETYECDTKGVSATRFPQIVKAAHRAFPKDPLFVVRQAREVVRIIIRAEMRNLIAKEGEPTLVSLFARVLKARPEQFGDLKAVEHIKGLFAKSDETGGELVTELSFIVKAMFRDGKTLEDLTEWMHFVSKVLYADQMAFQAALVCCKDNAQEFEVDVVKGPRLRLGVIRTDLAGVLQAMLYFRYDVVVIQNSKGQVQVCTSKKMRSRGFKITSAVEMWRWLELSPEDKRRYKLSDLGVAGNHPAVDNIFYHRGDEDNSVENVYNGSTTHPGVRPTQVALQAIIELIQYSFTDWGMKKWMHKWVFVREKKVQKPAPVTIVPAVMQPVRELPKVVVPKPIEAEAPVAATNDVAEALENATAGK